jgi:membrane protein
MLVSLTLRQLMNCEGCPGTEFTGLWKWLLGFYLGSGPAGSVYGAASSLIPLLLWVYYSSQIGAEFTQVYASRAGRGLKPAKYAVRIERKEIEYR